MIDEWISELADGIFEREVEIQLLQQLKPDSSLIKLKQEWLEKDNKRLELLKRLKKYEEGIIYVVTLYFPNDPKVEPTAFTFVDKDKAEDFMQHLKDNGEYCTLDECLYHNEWRQSCN